MFVVHNLSILSVILERRTCKCLWGQVFNGMQSHSLKRNASPLVVWVHYVQIYVLNPSFQSSRVYRILPTSLHFTCVVLRNCWSKKLYFKSCAQEMFPNARMRLKIAFCLIFPASKCNSKVLNFGNISGWRHCRWESFSNQQNSWTIGLLAS